MQTARLVFGWLGLAVGAGIILSGYSSRPSAGACAAINSVQHGLGQAATCSTTPGGGYFVLAGVFAVAGACLLVWHHMVKDG